FPRGKGQAYDYSNHVPLAVMWPRGIGRPGRATDDYVSFVDIAPTILEIAKLPWSRSGMEVITGQSLIPIFRGAKRGGVIAARDHVLIGKERNDIGRPDDVGYPIRGIIRDEMLYLRNFETDRWPTGNPETGYLDCDASPTKSLILQERREHSGSRFWDLGFGKRVAEELYDLRRDPDCVNNLAGIVKYRSAKLRLSRQMRRELEAQGDPRMVGKGGVFDRYPYADKSNRDFYNRYMRGEKLRAGWVLDSDFEPTWPR
ncbi:MAG: heparan N-sulfatase, partial [Acidobacteria bacterium]|nr:heparan N-sulfatase [Acidobacteriota bacterium]